MQEFVLAMNPIVKDKSSIQELYNFNIDFIAVGTHFYSGYNFVTDICLLSDDRSIECGFQHNM